MSEKRDQACYGDGGDAVALPAGLIDRFAIGSDQPGSRRVWVGHRGERIPRKERPDSLVDRWTFYRVPRSHTLTDRDELWAGESRVNRALTWLTDREPLDGRVWLEVLVPFVASLLARTTPPDTSVQMKMSQVGNEGQLISVDEPIDHRRMLWQRILAPTMCASWTVVHGSGAPLLPTTDVGYCVSFISPRRKGALVQIGYAIPIGPDTVLSVCPRKRRRILEWEDERWVARITHVDTDDRDFISLRASMVSFAVEEAYGASSEAVSFSGMEGIPEASLLRSGGPGVSIVPLAELGAYEMDWFRAVGLVRERPSVADTLIGPVRWEIVKSIWNVQVWIAVNIPRGTGLRSTGGAVDLDLTVLREVGDGEVLTGLALGATSPPS